MRIFKLSCVILLFGLMAFSRMASAQSVPDPRPDIYSKLKCCDCNVSFDKCTCPEAVGMKTYIDGLLDSGMSKEDVFYNVAKKYTTQVITNERTRQGVEARLINE